MTKLQYFVSMLFVAFLGASAVAVAQSAVDAPTGNCVTSFDYDKMSDEQRDRLFPESH